MPAKARQQIADLLAGKAPSHDPQGEAYRLLLVNVCNAWHQSMDFLFERIDDYTELLMPDDLLSGNSILAYTREAMTPDACRDVEVIGWLYQFYISEKKDAVFEGTKNRKITRNQPPQLFPPGSCAISVIAWALWLLNLDSSWQRRSLLRPRIARRIQPGKHHRSTATVATPWLFWISSMTFLQQCDCSTRMRVGGLARLAFAALDGELPK